MRFFFAKALPLVQSERAFARLPRRNLRLTRCSAPPYDTEWPMLSYSQRKPRRRAAQPWVLLFYAQFRNTRRSDQLEYRGEPAIRVVERRYHGHREVGRALSGGPQ